MQRTLVINADDFGLTEAVNDGILHAHRHGILTSASLFANAPATKQAITLAHRTPTLGVGVHLALVDGTPTLSPSDVPTLVNEDERFRPTWRAFIVDALARRIALADIERELNAQVARVVAAGIRVTHLDAHKHVHAWPPVFRLVVATARRFGIPVVRVPFERVPGWLSCRSLGMKRRCRDAFENLALGAWAAADRVLARRAGLVTPRMFGRIDTGALDAGIWPVLAGRVRPGLNELMTHPGFVDEALERMRTRLKDSRAREVAALCAPGAGEVLRQQGVVLAHFGTAGRPVVGGDGSPCRVLVRPR